MRSAVGLWCLTTNAQRWAMVILFVAAFTSSANGQTTPTTVSLSSNVFVSSGGMTLGGQSGTLTDALGTVGTNPGWTNFTYGVNSPSTGGSLNFNSTSTSVASLKFFTSAPGNPTVSAAPANFVNTQSYSWTIISPKNSGASLNIRASDSSVDDLTNGGTPLSLTDQSQLATYNARLNAIYKFDASSWIDPATNAPIVTTGGSKVGEFTYSLSGWDGTKYTSIDLVYSPVPEPGLMLLVGMGGLACRRLRRLRTATAS